VELETQTKLTLAEPATRIAPRVLPRVQPNNNNCDEQVNKNADCGYVYVIVEKNSLKAKM
jgi:hypothetical protein